jgi:hypothetical protein
MVRERFAQNVDPQLTTVQNRVYEAAEQVKQKRESFALPARPVWWQAARRAISSLGG